MSYKYYSWLSYFSTEQISKLLNKDIVETNTMKFFLIKLWHFSWFNWNCTFYGDLEFAYRQRDKKLEH